MRSVRNARWRLAIRFQPKTAPRGGPRRHSVPKVFLSRAWTIRGKGSAMTLPWARRCRAFLACFLGVLLFLGGAVPGFSFALNGYRWPDGTQIAMHLQLTRFTTGLQDGSASWDASATDALNIWNQYLDTVQFVASEPSGSSGSDGANEVLFSKTVYGDSWPSNALAVTLKMSSQGSVFTETDVLFNDNLKWNSYRGPLQGSGATGTYDFHRVALHEFGHVLGLDHPNQHGQSVVAIMNSIISDLDQLADDDIAGGRSLYGVRITSPLGLPPFPAGNSFRYQITANNAPVSFDATGLPPGLSIDPNTGLISGTPTAGGTYSISLVAHGSPRDATAILTITLIASQITSTFAPSVHVNDGFNYTITATNHPFAFDVTALPAGLSLDRSTGVITGTLGTLGSFPITVIAHTPYGDGSALITIRVIPWDITSNYYPLATLGADFRFQITANNNPTSFEAINLPAGLQLDAATGLITGTIALSGSYNFSVVAHGAKGDAVGQMYLGVPAAPALQPKPAGALKTFDFAPGRLVSDPIACVCERPERKRRRRYRYGVVDADCDDQITSHSQRVGPFCRQHETVGGLLGYLHLRGLDYRHRLGEARSAIEFQRFCSDKLRRGRPRKAALCEWPSYDRA